MKRPEPDRCESPRPLAEMLHIARHLRDELAPHCDHIDIAGSVRRGKPFPGDIELLCVPRFGPLRTSGDLWPREGANLLDAYVAAQLSIGFSSHRATPGRYTTRPDVNGRVAVGPRYKRLAVDGVALDLFSCLPPASWAVLLLIRTGPAELSQRMVTQRSKGGVLPDDCYVRDGAIWRGDAEGRELVPIESEADWFALCGLEWREPEGRG